jgi:ferric-dicitrate binding protein FerR (iron transport regulator)
MNADTRIAYDEVDNLRRLTLSGEAYFEVTKQLFTDRKGIIGAKPFIVKTKDMQIEVLGTHFNVSAYPNEKIQRTTLMEGKVKVTNGKQAYVLHPGEEVKLEAGKLARKVVETDQSAAWKDGYFIFNDDKLSDILAELSNWYDVDVVYLDEEVKDERFEGMLSRNSQLKDIINVLESTDRVTFKFKKRTIYVSKK